MWLCGHKDKGLAHDKVEMHGIYAVEKEGRGRPPDERVRLSSS